MAVKIKLGYLLYSTKIEIILAIVFQGHLRVSWVHIEPSATQLVTFSLKGHINWRLFEMLKVSTVIVHTRAPDLTSCTVLFQWHFRSFQWSNTQFYFKTTKSDRIKNLKKPIWRAIETALFYTADQVWLSCYSFILF